METSCILRPNGRGEVFIYSNPLGEAKIETIKKANSAVSDPFSLFLKPAG
jgi:hypothetical protein